MTRQGVGLEVTVARRPSLAWGRFTSLANLAQSPPVMATLCQGNQCGTGDWREGSKLWPVQTTLPAPREGEVWGRMGTAFGFPGFAFPFPNLFHS